MEIYVKPSPDSPCPVKTCLTLSQFSTKQVLDSLKHNCTLLFVPGSYTLESKISVTNVSNISLISFSFNNVSIFCNQNASFKFEGISKLSIAGFKFIGCGKNRAKLVNKFLLENTTFIGDNESETALELENAEVNIIACSFMYNRIGSLRGPIRILQGYRYQHAYVGGAIIANQSSIAIIGNEFVGNKAQIGGAIFVTQGSEVVIKNSSFIGNNATNYSMETSFGGALYIEDGTDGKHNMLTESTVVISESEFSDNIATNGGALTAINTTVNIISSKVCNNMAEMFGGAMYIQAGSRLNVNQTEMHNNQAFKKGGGVAYINASAANINAGQIYNNLAGTSGGVILANGNCFLSFNGSSVYNNSAQQWIGGVIALGNSKEVHSEVISSIMIYNSIFDSNFANCTGGVLNVGYASNITIVKSTFVNNLAIEGGGAFECESVSMTIKYVHFIHNTAVVGGAIRMLQSKVTFGGVCTLVNNSAIGGGAIYAVDSTLQVAHATIAAEHNAAYARGGALYIYQSRLLCKYNCTVKLSYNEAQDKGGGICAMNSVVSVISEGNPNVESSISFIRNGAIRGGGVYLELNSQLLILKLGTRHCVQFYFTENSAYYGGAIYVRDRSFIETCSVADTVKFQTYDGTYCFVQVTSHEEISDFS